MDGFIGKLKLCLNPKLGQQDLTADEKESLQKDLNNAKNMKTALGEMAKILDETDVEKKGSDAAQRYGKEHANYTEYYYALKKYDG